MLPPAYRNALTYNPRMIAPSRYPRNVLAGVGEVATAGPTGSVATPQAAPQGTPEPAGMGGAPMGAAEDMGAMGGQYGGVFGDLGVNPQAINSLADFQNSGLAAIGTSLGPMGIIGGALGTVGAGMMGAKDPVGMSNIGGFLSGLGDYGVMSGGIASAAVSNDGFGDKDLSGATGGSPDAGKDGPGTAGDKGPDGGSFRVGGYTGNDGDGRLEPMSATLHEGEFVLRPEAVAMFGRPLLEMMNRGDGNALLAAFAQRPPVTSWMQGAPIYPNEPPTRMPEMMPEGPGQRSWDIPPSPSWFTNALRDLRRI